MTRVEKELMNEKTEEAYLPKECASKIFEVSGMKFEPDIAADLWEKLLQHK